MKGQKNGAQILGEREIGKFRPRAWDLRREARELASEEERQALRRLAMTQATLTGRREMLAKKMYQGEPITLEDWPGLAPLTPRERTRIMEDVRKVYGLREAEKCSCPQRANGMHYTDCRVRR